jgi:pimeloyl-ACP methyl ester carboxylesterase
MWMPIRGGRLGYGNQPRLLVVWGMRDLSFDPGEPERYRWDVPSAEVHLLDAPHFALDVKADEIAGFMWEFMRTNQERTPRTLKPLL